MRQQVWLAAIAALLSTPSYAAGPYAPAAGKPGSTAVSKDDPAITNWATGYLNYVQGADC